MMKRIMLTFVVIMMFATVSTTVFADTLNLEVNADAGTVEIKNNSTFCQDHDHLFN